MRECLNIWKHFNWGEATKDMLGLGLIKYIGVHVDRGRYACMHTNTILIMCVSVNISDTVFTSWAFICTPKIICHYPLTSNLHWWDVNSSLPWTDNSLHTGEMVQFHHNSWSKYPSHLIKDGSLTWPCTHCNWIVCSEVVFL